MNIGVPRYLIVGMAALFSSYHIILAIYSLDMIRDPQDPAPIFLAIGIYAVATAISLSPWGPTRMPVWMAAFNVAVVVAITLLVSNEIDLQRDGGTGYATWYVAASGTLLTITSTRRRHMYAWLGIAFLVVHTAVWADLGGLLGLGVIGSAMWVAVSHVLSTALAKATKDAQRFAIAEREATDWQAAQEAHVYERQFRLGQTSAMALRMLGEIRDSRGDLSDAQRQECVYLEGAIRDEIRGRKLLNDAVRDEVMAARRRGATVTLLDEGGLDDLPDDELDRVLNHLASAIGQTDADKIIARTVPEGSDTAITVVGLRTVDDSDAVALGQDSSEDDEVDLWLEIPRTVPVA